MLYQFDQIVYAANVIYSEYVHFICESWSGVWVAEVMQVLTPNKNPGVFLVGNTSYICHTLLLAELSTSRATPLGGDTWNLEPGLSHTSPHVCVPFAEFNLYSHRNKL